MKPKINDVLILGAGITGLSAGYASGLPIYEAQDSAGGICASYYMTKNGKERLAKPPKNDEAYRFEIGGGHWIFGGDPSIKRFMNNLTPCSIYSRKSSVYLPDEKLFVPYPMQNNLSFLDKKIAQKALEEITDPPTGKMGTFADWLNLSFGDTLCNLFFNPFHKLYTANLYEKISPQDGYKSPINREDVISGFEGKSMPVGYNANFIYPSKGLDSLINKLEKKCDVRYGKRVIKINTDKKTVSFSDGGIIPYQEMISTLPLNKIAKMAGIDTGEKTCPSSSVLVVNIGAKKGKLCPSDQWIYVPKSKPGFHRVGFYSNVDAMFLPKSHRIKKDHVSIYVEKAYKEEEGLSREQTEKVCQKILEELNDWEWISETEVCDPTWIETAYTWSWPNSKWKEKTLKELEKKGIYQIGRYGRWIFQGIADSIKDGLMIGGSFL